MKPKKIGSYQVKNTSKKYPDSLWIDGAIYANLFAFDSSNDITIWGEKPIELHVPKGTKVNIVEF